MYNSSDYQWHKKQILVVEDDENTREAVCEILKALNYHAMPAADGAEALQMFEWRQDENALLRASGKVWIAGRQRIRGPHIGTREHSVLDQQR